MGYVGRAYGEHILLDMCSIEPNIGNVQSREKTYYALKGGMQRIWLGLDEHERLSSHSGLVLEETVPVKYFPLAPALTVIVDDMSTNITGDQDNRHVSIRLTHDYTGFHYPCAANYFYNYLMMDIRVSNGQRPIYKMYHTMAACLREGVREKFPGSFLEKYRAECAQIVNRDIYVEALKQGTLWCDLDVPPGVWQQGI
jgi:hypothetical protein